MSGRQGSAPKRGRNEEEEEVREDSLRPRVGPQQQQGVTASPVGLNMEPNVLMDGPFLDDNPSFFGALDLAGDKQRDFMILRCKHTLADLVHDYGQAFLMTYFDGGRPIVDRILRAYSTVIGDQAVTLTNVLGTYTSDAKAKQLFLKDLDEYCFRHEGIASFQELNPTLYNISQDDGEESELGNLRTKLSDYAGGYSWFLDAQSGNVIRDVERKKQIGTPQNGFIKDLAYQMDPGSGMDASKYCVEIPNEYPLDVPGTKSSLGLTANVAGNTDITLTWEDRLPITISPGTNSIESAKILIMIEPTIEKRLDILFSKTAGDRFQGFSASNRWHTEDMNDGKPVVLVTNDILASYDMAMYKRASVLLTGISELKLYQFGEEIIPMISDPSGVLVGIRSSNEAFNAHIDRLVRSIKDRIRDYFAASVGLLNGQRLITFHKGGDGPTTFNGYTYDPSGLETKKMTAGMVFFLIDQVEKLYNYESMKVKMEEARIQFRDISDQTGEGGYPIKYKPLLDEVEFGKYVGLTELYKPKISYNSIASAISALEFNFTKSSIYALYSGITMLLTNINVTTFPKNFIAFLITAILCDVTTPRGRGSTRGADTTEAAIAWRTEWLRSVLNKPEIVRILTALFVGERNLLKYDGVASTGGAGGDPKIIGFNISYDPVRGMTDTQWSIISEVLQRIVRSSFVTTTFDDVLLSYAGVVPIDELRFVIGYVSDVTIPDIMSTFRPPAPIPVEFYQFVKKVKDSNQDARQNIKQKLQNRSIQPRREDIPIYQPAPRGLNRVSKRQTGQRGGGGPGGLNGEEIYDYIVVGDDLKEFMDFPYDEVDRIYDLINNIIGNEKIPIVSIDIDDIFHIFCSSLIVASILDTSLETNPLMILSAVGKFYENIDEDNDINSEILELLDNLYVSNLSDEYLYCIDDIVDIIDYITSGEHTVGIENDEGTEFMKEVPSEVPALLSLGVTGSYTNVSEVATQEFGNGSMTPLQNYKYVTPPPSPTRKTLISIKKNILQSPSRRFGTPSSASVVQTPVKVKIRDIPRARTPSVLTILYTDDKKRGSLPTTGGKGSIGSRLNERISFVTAAPGNENLGGGGARTSRRRRRRQHTYKKRKSVAARHRQTKRRHH